MIAIVVRTPMTVDDLASIRVGLDRGRLIGGVLVLPDDAPGRHHRRAVSRLQARFVVHRDAHPRAGTMLRRVAAPGDEPGPELWWVPDDDRPVLDTRSWREAAPVLVVEAPPPVDRGPGEHFRTGALEVWIVDADAATVTVHRPGEQPVVPATTLTTPLIPGWVVDLEELFRR